MIESTYVTYTEEMNLLQEDKRESPTPKRAFSIDKLKQNGFSEVIKNPYFEPSCDKIPERRKSVELKMTQEQPADSTRDRKNSKNATDFKIGIFTKSENGLQRTPRKDG